MIILLHVMHVIRQSDRGGLQRDDCNVSETGEGDLNVTLVAHNHRQANIVVSWAHLNLNGEHGRELGHHTVTVS